jgi:hypothetical protein
MDSSYPKPWAPDQETSIRKIYGGIGNKYWRAAEPARQCLPDTTGLSVTGQKIGSCDQKIGFTFPPQKITRSRIGSLKRFCLRATTTEVTHDFVLGRRKRRETTMKKHWKLLTAPSVSCSLVSAPLNQTKEDAVFA